MLLGGTAKYATKINREITEIEQSILDGLFRIILHDLRIAWNTVTPVEFTIESHETDPQLMQILAPNEAVVAVSMEARIGENAGMMNIGIPSIVVKMLRHKFDQQWSLRKTESTDAEQGRILRLIKSAALDLDTRLVGPTLRVEDLLDIQVDDVLTFDYPVGRPLDLLINGVLKYRGNVVGTGRNRAFEVGYFYRPSD
jgi:flagellar motor switch protein FliM